MYILIHGAGAPRSPERQPRIKYPSPSHLSQSPNLEFILSALRINAFEASECKPFDRLRDRILFNQYPTHHHQSFFVNLINHADYKSARAQARYAIQYHITRLHRSMAFRTPYEQIIYETYNQ